jgi:hypothetical protein
MVSQGDDEADDRPAGFAGEVAVHRLAHHAKADKAGKTK